MPVTDKLDCLIYVDANVSLGELASFIVQGVGGTVSGPAFGMTVTTPLCDIEVRPNPDRGKVGSGVDAVFLYFTNILEIYPVEGFERAAMVDLIGALLRWFWSRGWNAVAACDYEAELPCRGGIGKKTIDETIAVMPANGDIHSGATDEHPSLRSAT